MHIRCDALLTNGSAGNKLCVCAPRWTTHARLLQQGYHNTCKEEEPCVLGVGTEPSFAIGQRALLIQTGALPMLLCARCVSAFPDHSMIPMLRHSMAETPLDQQAVLRESIQL